MQYIHTYTEYYQLDYLIYFNALDVWQIEREPYKTILSANVLAISRIVYLPSLLILHNISSCL